MSLGPAQLLRGLAVLVFLVGWAVLAHLGSSGDSHLDLSVLLGVAPIIAALGLLLWRTRHPLLAGSGIDHVTLVRRNQPLRAALSNSFAFGGSNAVLAFRAVTQ